MAFAQSELFSLKKLWQTGTTGWQLGSGTPCTSSTAENIDIVNDLVLSQEGAPGTHKTGVRSSKKLAFCRGQWDASYTKTFSESAWRNDVSMVGNPAQNHWLQNRLNARVKAIHFEHLLWCVCP